MFADVLDVGGIRFGQFRWIFVVVLLLGRNRGGRCIVIVVVSRWLVVVRIACILEGCIKGDRGVELMLEFSIANIQTNRELVFVSCKPHTKPTTTTHLSFVVSMRIFSGRWRRWFGHDDAAIGTGSGITLQAARPSSERHNGTFQRQHIRTRRDRSEKQIDDHQQVDAEAHVQQIAAAAARHEQFGGAAAVRVGLIAVQTIGKHHSFECGRCCWKMRRVLSMVFD